jgi:hypothetical protein
MIHRLCRPVGPGRANRAVLSVLLTGIAAVSSAQVSITIPVAASLHGVPPTFFHSDVRVFNQSSTSSVAVTATYHCFAPPCGESPQTFTLVPREMLVFDDIIANLFAHPESGGAIEFSSSDSFVITSRLYTPSRPLPTSGMGVPGLPESDALAVAVVTSLSHSADASKGFRSNVGAYNASDVGQTVTFKLFNAIGTPIGQVSKTAPARTPVQINVFAEAHIATDVPDAYCVVSGDRGLPLLVYAGVVDNQSQDLAFIQGRANDGRAGTFTIPVAASLHGLNASFFHTDTTILNASSSPAIVTARYRCSSGSCGNATQTLTLAPRQMRPFDDIIANLFGAPESGGAIQFGSNSPFVVNSRLYTPSRPLPTNGMGVPGLSESAPIVSVLTSLSHSTDLSQGFRSNVGAYNPNDVAQNVTFELFDPVANSLGHVSRNVPARTPVQINVFAEAGITIDVPDAYCVVSGDRGLPLLTYAGVIDNQSQDLTFIKGEDSNSIVIVVDSADRAASPAGRGQ